MDPISAEAIQQEIAREVDQLLRVIFHGRRKTGRLDLEARNFSTFFRNKTAKSASILLGPI